MEEYKRYKVILHFIYTAEVEAPDGTEAISNTRNLLNCGGSPEETNAEVVEI